MNAINTLEISNRSNKLEEWDVIKFDVLQFIELNKNSIDFILKIKQEMSSIVFYWIYWKI